jgi:hypothetical protein
MNGKEGVHTGISQKDTVMSQPKWVIAITTFPGKIC